MSWALDMDDFKHGYPLISAVAERYRVGGLKSARGRAMHEGAWLETRSVTS
jgi:hypothetical protein